MIFRLVQNVDGQFIVHDFNEANVLPAMEIRGYEFKGSNANHRVRAELQGAPVFTGVSGPMFDGHKDGVPVIRYECAEAYARLSA